ncbi:MAG: Gfo/Idh/MocA family oxidoreductase [Roseibium sp.]
MTSTPAGTAADKGIVRWGIVGCGDVTEIKSGPALQKADRSELISVMRRDAEKAADYAERHNVPSWTADADELINNPDISAIYIATPPSTHADFTIKALEAGKHVLTEKPMALDLNECNRMAAAATATGNKLCVAYYRRALPRFEKLREIVQDGTIGTPRMVEVRHFLPESARPAQAWKLNPQVGGGGFFPDMQTHTLDWLTYVFGEPDAVKGLTKHQAGHYAAEDLVNYLVDFGDVTALGLCAYATGRQEESVTVHGSKGSASMGFFRPSAINLEIDGTSETIELSDPPHVHQPFVERVIAHILDDAPNPCSPEDGRRSTEIMRTIYSGL